MGNFPNKLSDLCSPSYVYFIISMMFMIIASVQNIGNNNTYKLGLFSCMVPSCIAIFIAKLIYILFWTWILNLICNDGHKNIAWFLLFLPFILFFIMIGLVMLSQRKDRDAKRN